MKVPLEISFRGVKKTDDIEDIIRKKAEKLDAICDNLISCRVAVEMPQQHQQRGNPFRVRIETRFPPGKEVIVKRESSGGEMHDQLPKVIRGAFEAAFRQLKSALEQQRGDVKSHPQQQSTMAVVVRIFREQGFGFIRSLDGREIYFHQNSVINNDFERLEIGTGVRFFESMGDKGPQASTVEIVDKPGARASKTPEPDSEAPMGWEEG